MICQFTAQLRKFWLRTLIVFSQEQVGLKFRALLGFLKQENMVFGQIPNHLNYSNSNFLVKYWTTLSDNDSQYDIV